MTGIRNCQSDILLLQIRNLIGSFLVNLYSIQFTLRIPPDFIIAWLAFVHKFIIIWCIWVGSARTVPNLLIVLLIYFNSWREGGLMRLSASVTIGCSWIGLFSKSTSRLKVYLLNKIFPAVGCIVNLFKIKSQITLCSSSSSAMSYSQEWEWGCY